MNLKVLKPDQVNQIHELTEKLIAETGFSVQHKELLKIARKNGADIDEENGTVKIPPERLRELLALVPETYEIQGLDGNKRIIGSTEKQIYSIVTDPWIIDYETRRPRRPSLEDVRRHTILTQLNPRSGAVSLMDFPVTDCADRTSNLRALEIHLLHHGKHCNIYPGSLESFRRWFEIGNILSRGRDLSESNLLSAAVAVKSPLTIGEFNGQILLDGARNNFTILPTICPMAGTTGPYSPDTVLLQGNTEEIFLAALTQMINPGNPFLYIFGPSISNMRTGHDQYYTLDKVLWKIASCELAESYCMPSGAECGGTMSFRYDMQSGAESMLFMLSALASGTDVLSGLGSCYNANGISAEMMVIQSEWLRAAEYLTRGIDTGNLEKRMENIQLQGPGGEFLTDDLTLELLRSSEFFEPGLFDDSGEDKGAASLLERAHDRVETLIRDYESPVPEDIQEELRRYFRDQYSNYDQ
ncbi:MAG: trimethylamine methyltransferase family protein [Spirochaetia bacterium]